MPMSKKAVVIGSGFGGIACAIRLQNQGFSTILLEKRDKPGGRAYVYQDKGFTFDAGPTVITAPPAIEELFEISQKQMKDYVTFLPVDPFYRLCWEDGVRFDYVNDEEKLLAQIKALCPEDVEGYQEFFKYSTEVFKEGYENLVHVPFLKFWDMIRVSPQLLRLKAYRSVFKTVSSYIKEPHLRQGFSFHSLLIGGNPFTASSIYTLIHSLERKWGVFFPKGGTGALVNGLLRLFTDLGGEISLNSNVEKIETESGKVKSVILEGGKKIPCDIVVSNADVFHTYDKLLSEEKKASFQRFRLYHSRYSMSLFLIYFGTNKKYPEIPHHSVIFGNRYKELLEDIFENGVLAKDFSLYLHAPCKTDPALAPEGSEAFYVLAPVPHLGKLNLDWEKAKRAYADSILAYLEKHYMPDLRKHIVTERLFTPTDFKTELNAHLGSAFSLEPTLTQSAYFRVCNRDPKIKGMYFVGAGTHPGAGVPGVINSAKATAHVIALDHQTETSSIPQASLQGSYAT